jgi:hypothetical protein
MAVKTHRDARRGLGPYASYALRSLKAVAKREQRRQSVPRCGAMPLDIRIPFGRAIRHVREEQKFNPMPFDASDADVVGTVNAGQAYLSNDRRNIYSEFKLKLQEIIKTSDAPYLRVADSIDIQRKGGAVRLPSGKVVTRAALADSMPDVGKRYLLFLKFNKDTEDYWVLTGYQLEGNEVYRLDDLNFSESNHQGVTHPLRKEGVNEDQFLARAKSTFLSRATGAN